MNLKEKYGLERFAVHEVQLKKQIRIFSQAITYPDIDLAIMHFLF